MKAHAIQSKPIIKHLLTGKELTKKEILSILEKATELKKTRMQTRNDLQGYHLALLFDKPSLRTRISFTLAMRELGGNTVESAGNTRKTETPEDQARVLSGYCHAIMVRTNKDSDLEQMSRASTIPIINGLSDLHHPCQILSDLFTIQETFNTFKNITLCYIGDGNNILHSLLSLAPLVGINIHFCCPTTRGPDILILAKSIAGLHADTGIIKIFNSPEAAIQGADIVYTDVWASMGFEDQAADNLFAGFQVNEQLMQKTLPHAIFMHCLPMIRGKEVSETLPDQQCSVIFRQSENRLHVQKALLLHLLT